MDVPRIRVVEKKHAGNAVAVVFAAVMAAAGLWLFWVSDSDSVVLIAIGAVSLGLGLTAARAATKGVVRMVRPGLLEEAEHSAWVDAAAKYREPGPFHVVLESAGLKKIDVVKAIREVTGLDVARAKSMAEAPPALVTTGVSGQSADRIAELFRDAGASVRVADEG
jgi:ribosomal protein L7/L12